MWNEEDMEKGKGETKTEEVAHHVIVLHKYGHL